MLFWRKFFRVKVNFSPCCEIIRQINAEFVLNLIVFTKFLVKYQESCYLSMWFHRNVTSFFRRKTYFHKIFFTLWPWVHFGLAPLHVTQKEKVPSEASTMAKIESLSIFKIERLISFQVFCFCFDINYSFINSEVIYTQTSTKNA